MKSWQKLVVAVFVLVYIAFLGGCGREIEFPVYKPPPEKKVPQYSLEEIERESLSALTLGSQSPFLGDPILASLNSYKEAPIQPETIEAPQVKIISPKDGEYLANSVTIKVWVTPKTNPVKEVNIYIDGVKRATLSSPPYEWEWNVTQEARTEHKIKVSATDGEKEGSDEVKVYVVVEGVIGLLGAQYHSAYGSARKVNYYNPLVGDYLKGLLVEGDKNSSAYVIYRLTPPHPFKYLEGSLQVNGTSLSGEEPAFYVYNWGKGNYESQVYDYETKEYLGSIVGSTFGFPYFEPGKNTVWVKVVVPPKSRYLIESLNLSFKYVYDKQRPSLTGMFTETSRVKSGYVSHLRFAYHLSEEAFVTVYIYNSSGKLVATLKRPDPRSYNWMDWNVPSQYTVGKLKYRIKAVDPAGNYRLTSLKRITPLSPAPQWQSAQAVKEEGTPYLLPPSYETTEAKFSVLKYSYASGNVQKVRYYGTPDFDGVLIGPYESKSYVVYSFKVNSSKYEYANLAVSFDSEEIYNTGEVVYKIYNYATNQYDAYLYNFIASREADNPLASSIYKEKYGSGVEIPYWYVKPGDGRVRIKIEVPPRAIYLLKDKVSVRYRISSDYTPPSVTQVYARDTRPGDGKVEIRYHTSEDMFTTIRLETASGSLVRRQTWGDQKGFVYHYCWIPPQYYGKRMRFSLTLKDQAGNSTNTGYYYFTVPSNP